MKIDKNNAIEEVKRLLKEMKCVFTYDDQVFEIFVGSESCFIQVEIEYNNTLSDYDKAMNERNHKLEDDIIVMDFYDNPEDSLFEISEEIETSEDIEEYIGQIVSFTKDKIKILKKINNHINAIQELCDSFDPQIDIDKFIEINYDFSEYN